MNWFYEADGKQQGPVSEAELDRMILSGRLTPATLVWREGLPDWVPLSTVRATEPSGPTVKCSSCNEPFPASDLVQIGGQPVCPNCKLAVLKGLQQGSMLEGLGEEQRNMPSWERREQIGMPVAAWQTIQEVLLKPVETFSAMKRTGGYVGPLIYVIALGSIGGVVAIMYSLISNTVLQGFLPKPTYPEPIRNLMQFYTGAVGLILMAILMPLNMAIRAFVSPGITHLCLMLCGGARRGFETTFRVYCYSYGSALPLQIIPFCGPFAAYVWAIVADIIGLAKAHEIDTWRAIVAVLLPFFVCCGGAMVIFAAAMAAAGMAHH